MPLLTVTDAHLAFGHVPLLDGVDFSIDAGERVALIGRNGTGKSSLLRAIAGLSALDDGLIARQGGASVGHVPQEPAFEPGHTVAQAVAAGLSEQAARLAEYESLAARLGGAPDGGHDALLERMQALQAELEASGAWALAGRVERVLARLGLDAAAPVESLSGGTQKRVALARALVAEPDLLLLDEPTNHLDIESIVWLEDLLRAHRGAVLFITHDRRFLDRVATRIVELDRGRLRSYPGTFSAYEARKEQELAAEQVANANLDKLLAQEEVWIRKGVEARRTRAVGRVRRLEALRAARAARRERAGDVRLALSQGERGGKLVAELTDVAKAWAGRAVVRDFSTIVQRGDRVGLIGPNGAGKTTLLKLILGEIAPDAGRVRRGTGLAVAYFDQMRAQLDPEATLADTISPGSEWVEAGGRRTHVMSYLSDFLFAPERARSPVRTLSGGERNRLLLARLFARPANLLVMDEPTNDLDIDTLELLEQLLADYAGTLLLVSHDRAFLDNVVTQTIVAEGDGHWREYVGGYADYEAARRRAVQDAAAAGGADASAPDAARRAAASRPGAAAASRAAPPSAGAASSSGTESPLGAASLPGAASASAPDAARPAAAGGAARRARLTYKEQRELDALPARIAALEAEQRALAARLADPSGYQTDPQAMQAAHVRHARIDEELLECLERWEALEAAGGKPA